MAPDEILLRIQQSIVQRDLASARREITSSAKAYPGDPRLYNFLGIVEAQENRHEEAATAFRTAVEHAPRFTGAWLNLGRLYQETQKNDPTASKKALQAYQAVLAYEPANAEANYQAAVLLMQQNSFRPALLHLARLPAEAQERAQVLSIRCAAQAALGELTAARGTARKLLESPDLSEADVLTIVPILERRKRLDMAVELLEGLDRRKLVSVDSIYLLARLYEQQNKLVEARASLERVGAAKPPTEALLLDLARIAYLQRDLTGTLGYLGHARDLNPSNASIHFFFGVVAIEMDLAVDAQKSLLEAVRLAPENPWHNYAMGAVASMGREAGEAIPYFQKFCALRPGDPRGRLALGMAYYEAKQYDAARTELQKIAARPETASGANYYLGRLAMIDDDLPAAETHLKKAVAANPQNADAWASLGHVYTQQSNFAAAVRALEQAVKLQPEGHLPNLNLLIFYQRTKDPRTEKQRERFNEVQKKREERAKALLRMVDVRPY